MIRVSEVAPNTQLLRFVFYLNCNIPTNLSKSSVSGVLKAFKRDVKPPKRIRGREDVKYSREPNLASSLFMQWFCRVMFQVSISRFTTNLSILQRRFHFKYRFQDRL